MSSVKADRPIARPMKTAQSRCILKQSEREAEAASGHRACLQCVWQFWLPNALGCRASIHMVEDIPGPGRLEGCHAGLLQRT